MNNELKVISNGQNVMNNEPKVTNNEQKGINSKHKYSWVPNRRTPLPLLIIGESFNPDKLKGKINPKLPVSFKID